MGYKIQRFRVTIEYDQEVDVKLKIGSLTSEKTYWRSVLAEFREANEKLKVEKI
jgi:hypothetical protein